MTAFLLDVNVLIAMSWPSHRSHDAALRWFGANHHLRQSLVFLNVPVMAQPEAYIGNAGEMFDDHGNLINDSTREFTRKFMLAFSEWVLKITAPKV